MILSTLITFDNTPKSKNTKSTRHNINHTVTINTYKSNELQLKTHQMASYCSTNFSDSTGRRANGARGGVAPPSDIAEVEYCCFASALAAVVERRMDGTRDLVAALTTKEETMVVR